MEARKEHDEERGSPLPGEGAGASRRLDHPEELLYHLFVERVHDYAVFLMDREGRITHWGEGARRMKEFAPDEIVGRHLRDLYPPGGAEDGGADEHLEHAAEHGEYIGEGTRIARDRGTFPARVVLTALRRHGELFGFSKVTQDLTERKRTEERLQRALAEAQSASATRRRSTWATRPASARSW